MGKLVKHVKETTIRSLKSTLKFLGLELPKELAYNQALLTNATSPTSYVGVMYGTGRKAGVRIATFVTGDDNQYLYAVYALSHGPIKSISNPRMDDVSITTDAKIKEYVEWSFGLGELNQDATTNPLIAELGSLWDTVNGKLQGIAFAIIKLTLNEDNMSSFGNVTFDLEGRLLFDPRDSQIKFSDNPALCALDYQTDSIYGNGMQYPQNFNVATYIDAANYFDEGVSSGGVYTGACWFNQGGRDSGYFSVSESVFNNIAAGELYAVTGFSDSSENFTGIVISKEAIQKIDPTLAEDMGLDPVYGNQSQTDNYKVFIKKLEDGGRALFSNQQITFTLVHTRYTCNGNVDTSQTIYDNLVALSTSFNGFITFFNGVSTILPDRPEVITTSFDSSNIISDIQIQLPDKPSQLNEVTGTWFDPEFGYDQMTETVASSEYLARDKGIVQPKEINMPFCNSPSIVRRILTIELNKSRHGGAVIFETFWDGLAVQAGDVIDVTDEALGWVGGSVKELRVIGIGIPNIDNEVELTCIPYDADDYIEGVINPRKKKDYVEYSSSTNLAPPTNITVTKLIGRNGLLAKVEWTMADNYSESFDLEVHLVIRDGGNQIVGYTEKLHYSGIKTTSYLIPSDLVVGSEYEFRVYARGIDGVRGLIYAFVLYTHVKLASPTGLDTQTPNPWGVVATPEYDSGDAEQSKLLHKWYVTEYLGGAEPVFDESFLVETSEQLHLDTLKTGTEYRLWYRVIDWDEISEVFPSGNGIVFTTGNLTTDYLDGGIAESLLVSTLNDRINLIDITNIAGIPGGLVGTVGNQTSRIVDIEEVSDNQAIRLNVLETSTSPLLDDKGSLTDAIPASSTSGTGLSYTLTSDRDTTGFVRIRLSGGDNPTYLSFNGTDLHPAGGHIAATNDPVWITFEADIVNGANTLLVWSPNATTATVLGLELRDGAASFESRVINLETTSATEASKVTQLVLDVDAVEIESSVTKGTVDGLVQTKYSVKLNGDGYATGFELLGGGGESSFKLVSDQIVFENTAVGGTDIAPFSIINNEVLIAKARIDDLRYNKLRSETTDSISTINNVVVGGSFSAPEGSITGAMLHPDFKKDLVHYDASAVVTGGTRSDSGTITSTRLDAGIEGGVAPNDPITSGGSVTSVTFTVSGGVGWGDNYGSNTNAPSVTFIIKRKNITSQSVDTILGSTVWTGIANNISGAGEPEEHTSNINQSITISSPADFSMPANGADYVYYVEITAKSGHWSTGGATGGSLQFSANEQAASTTGVSVQSLFFAGTRWLTADDGGIGKGASLSSGGDLYVNDFITKIANNAGQLFDGGNRVYSPTSRPTTLAGYGITDGGGVKLGDANVWTVKQTFTAGLSFGTATTVLSNSGASLRIQTSTGYTDIGSTNTSWSHFYTDRAGYYFNKKIAVVGDIYSYTNSGNKINSTGLFDNNNRVYSASNKPTLSDLGVLDDAHTWLGINTFSAVIKSSVAGDIIQDSGSNRILHNGGSVVLGNLTKALRLDGSTVSGQDSSGTFNFGKLERTQTWEALQTFSGGMTFKTNLYLNDTDGKNRMYFYSGAANIIKGAGALDTVAIADFRDSRNVPRAYIYGNGDAVFRNAQARKVKVGRNINFADTASSSASGILYSSLIDDTPIVGFGSHWDGAAGTITTAFAVGTGSTWYNGDLLKLTGTGELTVSGSITTSGLINANGGIVQDGFTVLNGVDTWLRTNGSTGWLSATYGGGIYMTDSTYVRTYANKGFYAEGNLKIGGSAEMDYGIHGGYGNSNGSGSAWGANIWSMGTSYDGAHAGTAYTRPNYGLYWLRSGMTAQGYNSYAGEGIYIASQNAVSAGIGHLGIWTSGNVTAEGDIKGFQTSDRSAKSNFAHFVDPLQGISTWFTGSYIKKGEYEEGIIAQDVQQYSKSLVTRGKDGLLKIRTGGHELHAITIGAVNQLHKKHNKEVSELKEEMYELRKLVEGLMNG